MSLDEIFKRLFGIGDQRGHPFDNSGYPGHPSDGPEDFGNDFSNFHEEMQRQMEEMTRQMQEMFHHGGSGGFENNDNSNFIVFQSPHLGGMGHTPGNPQTPRDQMLKQPDEDVQVPTGPVLSDGIPNRDIQPYRRHSPFGGIFHLPHFDIKPVGNEGPWKTSEGQITPPIGPNLDNVDHRVFSQHQSVSVRTIRGADGRVEHRKVVTRPDGKLEETVTRTLGDQSHSCTTTTDEQGVQQQTDTFKNMNQGDLSAFNEKWNTGSPGQGRQPPPSLPSVNPVFPQPNIPVQEDGILKKIFNAFKPKS